MFPSKYKRWKQKDLVEVAQPKRQVEFFSEKKKKKNGAWLNSSSAFRVQNIFHYGQLIDAVDKWKKKCKTKIKTRKFGAKMGICPFCPKQVAKYSCSETI